MDCIFGEAIEIELYWNNVNREVSHWSLSSAPSRNLQNMTAGPLGYAGHTQSEAPAARLLCLCPIASLGPLNPSSTWSCKHVWPWSLPSQGTPPLLIHFPRAHSPSLLIHSVVFWVMVQSASQLLTLFLTCGFFYPEDGDNAFLRNINSHSTHLVPHPRRRHSSNKTSIFILKWNIGH
jgi:hypothetical protein